MYQKDSTGCPSSDLARYLGVPHHSKVVAHSLCFDFEKVWTAKTKNLHIIQSCKAVWLLHGFIDYNNVNCKMSTQYKNLQNWKKLELNQKKGLVRLIESLLN